MQTLSSRVSVRPSQQQLRSRGRLVVRNAFDVRPYTLRSGDTLDSIAQKRGLTVEQVLKLNGDLNPTTALAGKTILLPANKLSSRDREILSGINTTYRVYPVRAGETLADIMSKRGITEDELQALNPGVNLSLIKDNQIVKLPSNKFTVREREMLIGSGIVPREFFEAAKNPFVVGAGILMAVCGFVLAWQRFQTDPDMVADD